MTITTTKTLLRRQRPAKATTMMATLLLLGACGTTPPSNFYTLNTVTDTTTGSAASRCEGLSVGVGPIIFPEYLQRPNIVTRVSPNKLAIDEFNRWGGSLQEDFERVFRMQLASVLSNKNIFPHPNNEDMAVDYRVSATVHQLDGRFGDSARLSGEWSLINTATRSVIITDHISLTEPLPGNDYEQLAAVYSRLVINFSNTVAAELSKHCGN